MPKLLLTVREAAETLSISRSKVYELMNSGTLHYVYIDTSRRVPTAALQAFVASLEEVA